ncbi:hypothetical protein T4B_13669 [Trichinella pseudospiralis]|uniref:Uncharacterized protein n=1 Tax=Trichinella pseudospiralis TaxID=6337 RepID=A0A0V1J1Z4_TRIPS|nr:hypothetical protein T4B_13669 [Trichinella pseudospiralis]
MELICMFGRSILLTNEPHAVVCAVQYVRTCVNENACEKKPKQPKLMIDTTTAAAAAAAAA